MHMMTEEESNRRRTERLDKLLKLYSQEFQQLSAKLHTAFEEVDTQSDTQHLTDEVCNYGL